MKEAARTPLGTFSSDVRELMETIFGRRGINCNHERARGADRGRSFSMGRGRRLCGILKYKIYRTV